MDSKGPRLERNVNVEAISLKLNAMCRSSGLLGLFIKSLFPKKIERNLHCAGVRAICSSRYAITAATNTWAWIIKVIFRSHHFLLHPVLLLLFLLHVLDLHRAPTHWDRGGRPAGTNHLQCADVLPSITDHNFSK